MGPGPSLAHNCCLGIQPLTPDPEIFWEVHPLPVGTVQMPLISLTRRSYTSPLDSTRRAHRSQPIPGRQHLEGQ